MPKTKQPEAVDLGFVPVAKLGEDAEKPDVFTQLLEGTGDDEQAVEQTDDDLATLEDHWRRLVDLKAAAGDAEEVAKDAKAAYNAQKERMADAMERQGTKQFRGADGGGCTITEQYTTALEDREAFMAWVQESHPELLVVHSQTRTKFIRENYRDLGIPEDDPSFPPGLKPGVMTGLQVRGARRPAAEKQGD
jgi:hypothetical protein